MRTAARRDANEGEIMDALRKVGASVWQISDEGIPDLLVCYFDKVTDRYETVLIEVKHGSNKLTEAQDKFFREFPGHNIHIAYTVDDALQAIGAIE